MTYLHNIHTRVYTCSTRLYIDDIIYRSTLQNNLASFGPIMVFYPIFVDHLKVFQSNLEKKLLYENTVSEVSIILRGCNIASMMLFDIKLIP